MSNKNMTLDEQIRHEFQKYVDESESFENGTKVAASRARRSLSELAKLIKERRKEIQEKKNEM